MLKAKVQLLEALVDIHVALKMLSTIEDEGLHPMDRKYRQLDADISALENKSNQWKMVKPPIQSNLYLVWGDGIIVGPDNKANIMI